MRGRQIFIAMMLGAVNLSAEALADTDATASINDMLGELVDTTHPATAPATDPGKFLSSAMSLAGRHQWGELTRLAATAPAAIPEPLRNLVQSYAELRNGQTERGLAGMRAALAASAAKGRLPALLAVADRFGGQRESNAALFELCGNPAAADAAFTAVRWRVRDPAVVETAYEAARQAAPDAASVADYGRYRALLDGQAVDESEIRAAVAASPQAPLPRITLALAGLRSERPAEAWAAFDDITLIFDHAPPGARAVISAACAASGQPERAAEMATMINPAALLPSEYALIAPLRAAAISRDFGQHQTGFEDLHNLAP